MESTFANLVEDGDTVLIFVAGYFGLRMVDMASRYGGDIRSVTKSWGSVFSLDEIEAALVEHKPRIVGIVHADTSTGARQPLEGVAKLVRKQDALLIVDTVTR